MSKRINFYLLESVVLIVAALAAVAGFRLDLCWLIVCLLLVLTAGQCYVLVILKRGNASLLILTIWATITLAVSVAAGLTTHLVIGE